MNIVIIANGYPTKEDPQYGCFEKEQAIALHKVGHQVSILYVDGRFRLRKNNFGIHHLSENGIEIYGIRICSTTLLSRINFRLHYKYRSRMLDKLFRMVLNNSGKPDLIYAHFMYNIAYAVYLKKKYNIPLVGIEHWSILNSIQLPPLAFFWGNIAYVYADLIIAVSNSLKEQIYKHFQQEAIVVHNMIGEEFFAQSLGVKSRKHSISLVTVGSLLRVKGFDILVSALCELDKRYSSWSLKIVGGGIEEKSLKKQIEQCGLENKIKLVGRKGKQEIISILQESDVFISSSRSENFSVAVLEALSTGLPVVATLCGGIKECIDEKNGLLVPVEDANALADAIVSICRNIDNYDRKAIAEDCKQRFAPSVIAKQLTSIFEEVVASYHSQSK